MSNKLKSKKSSTKQAEVKVTTKQIAILSLLIIGAISIVGVLIFFAMQPPAEINYSPIELKSNRDGEVVSWVNVEAWGLTDTATITTYEDLLIYANWEKVIEGAAEDLRLDLMASPYGYWIKIDDTTGYFAVMWFHISGSEENYDITLWIIHNPSNVIFNNLNSSSLAAILPEENTDESYTIITKFPDNSANQMHYGGKFENTAANYAANPTYFRNQINWRSICPAYELDVDTYNKWDVSEGVMTSTFGFKLTANDTISLVDGNVTQINATIASAYDTTWNIQIIDDSIYMYVLGQLSGGFKLEYTMSLSINITIDSMESGWVSLPALIVDSFDALSIIT